MVDYLYKVIFLYPRASFFISNIVFIALSFVHFSSNAQGFNGIPDNFEFKHFTPANGLSQRSVMTILQDTKGYLWIGTRDGLNKFDGNKFTVYRKDFEDPNSLSNNSILSIYEDNLKNIWIGTQIGINKYNPKTDKFIRYEHYDKQKKISEYFVRSFMQIDNDLLWAATDNGIVQINIKTNAVTLIQKKPNHANSLTNNQTRFILKHTDGNIWICNTKFIDIYNPKNKTFKHVNYPKDNNNTHLNNLPTLYLDKKNTLWLGYEQGLAYYNRKQQLFVNLELEGRKAINTAVRSLEEDLFGNLWIGSYDGLYILNPSNDKLKHIVHDNNNATSLSQNSIYKIVRDSRGDMWMGTWADGLNYFNRDNDAFKNIRFGNNKLNYWVVSGIAEDSDKNLWIGTEGGGLNFYNTKTKKFTYFKNNPKDQNSIKANNVKSVIVDRNQNIWIGIHDGGVNFLNPHNYPLKFVNIDFPQKNNIALKGYKVLTLFEDKNGNIWIGTLTGGLIFYDVKQKLLSKIDNNIISIMSIVQTENNDVLLIGGDNGLETININTKKRNKIYIKRKSQNEPSLNVNCIFIDDLSNYWIGTEGEGLYVHNPKKNSTRNYRIKEGLPNNIIYGILPDGVGNIWLSTNNGISNLNIKSGIIKNYNHSDGLQGNEFNYGSYYKTKDNQLIFGGTNGLTYFNPKDIKKNKYIPNIDINNIDVNNLPYSAISDSTKTIILKYDENNFSIDFTALSYMLPQKNKFSYILVGNDKKWNEVGKQRKAVYTNIKEGNYVFKVKGSNNDGVWNNEGATLNITVLPAPWRTWWAYLIYFAILASLFLYIRKLILLRIRERKEKERLEQINQLKLGIFTDVSHDFRTPLTLIIGPLEKMIRENSGNAEIRQQHEIMLKNSKMLLQLINQILDFRKGESGTLTLQASKGNIVPFVEDVKKSFDLLAQKKNIYYHLSSEKDIEAWFDKNKLKNILYNLLSNAFKFTNAGSKISVSITTVTEKRGFESIDYVDISVVNFGEKIPESKLDLIFDQFYQLDQQHKKAGYGIGLALIKRLVDLHKGEIKVKSSHEDGTRFSILLRLGKQHLTAQECVDETDSLEEDGENQFYIDERIDDSIENINDSYLSCVNTYDEKQQNLLVVEDNLELQSFIKDIFTNKFNVYVANNGQQAIHIANNKAIDLIISDIQMPIMDGFDLCNNIKSTLLTSHIPVILLTAKTSPTHHEKGYEIGADAYIEKPFNSKILKLRVINILQTRANFIQKFKNESILEPENLAVTTPDEIFLKSAFSVVEQNINNEEFSASLFVDEMKMSRTVIYTKIKALTGQNISSFIRTIRLKKAGILLTETTTNVSQVAYEVGFNDLKYFRECFKEFYKVTPSEYKKKYSKKSE